MPISWIATISLISVGWIFFRANSWSQASQMLSALASPASYASHFLSSSLYLLIAVLAGGYAAVVAVSGIFDRPGESPEAPQSRTVALLARWRWFWIPPLYALALLFVWMITLTQSGGVGQLMYRSF
jgi:hypothetical protein